MPLFIAGVVRDRGVAARAVTTLLESGVPSSEIALAVREEAEEDVSGRGEIAADENQFRDLAIHSGWERLGWLGGARPGYRDVVPPDVEMVFLAAGPLAIAIGGAQVGASAGGIVGAMTNFGFQHDLAGQWYDALVEGRAWLMVRTTPDQGAAIHAVFEKHQAALRAESLRHW